jgi:Tfp pilus assembly protein PilZ
LPLAGTGYTFEESTEFAMSENFAEIVQKVDSCLRMHPNLSLNLLAEKLSIAAPLIEKALHAQAGINYKQFQEEKRLERAFEQLGMLSPAANGPYEILRARQRIVIPRATVRYGFPRFWKRSIEYSHICPLVDISAGGLALLTDSALEMGKRIALLLKFPAEDEVLQVHGRIVYSVATGIAGYRYRIGIQFLPFSGNRGENDPGVQYVLDKIEHTFAPGKPGSPSHE